MFYLSDIIVLFYISVLLDLFHLSILFVLFVLSVLFLLFDLSVIFYYVMKSINTSDKGSGWRKAIVCKRIYLTLSSRLFIVFPRV